LLAQLGIDTPDSEFFRVQDLPRSEQKNVLLASAAIPLLFALRQVNGKRYSDGGQGGWMKFQGNTPITPLLQHGCTTVIVTHLTDGSLWSRHDFPNVTVIEIRPQKSIQRENPLRDMLAFGTEHIPSWKEQGYSDALANVERIMRASTARRALRDSEQLVQQQELKARAFDEKMREAMRPIVVGADEDG
jgi:NTE family protein